MWLYDVTDVSGVRVPGDVVTCSSAQLIDQLSELKIIVATTNSKLIGL